jgi:hypothetical protein
MAMQINKTVTVLDLRDNAIDDKVRGCRLTLSNPR